MRTLITIVLLIGSQSIFAQVKPVTEFDVQFKVYRQALQYYDLQTAAVAMNHLMVLKPERKDLRDSLLMVYFTAERFAQAYVLGEVILKEEPNKKDVLEITALSKQQLGMNKEALSNYEKLFEISGDIYYLYQIAGVQYQLKRIGECLASTEVLTSNKTAAERKVGITNSDGSTQEVSLLAAALNIKALCLLETGKSDTAEAQLIEVLKLEPNFKLATANLQAIKNRKAQQTDAGNK